MRQLRVSCKGIESNPRAQCYRDIYEATMRFRQSTTMRSAYVIMGDFNEEYEIGAQAASLFSGVSSFAEVMGVDDAMQFKHGGADRARCFWSRKEGRSLLKYSGMAQHCRRRAMAGKFRRMA